MKSNGASYPGSDERVLVLLPQTLDAQSIGPVLEKAGVTSHMCATPEELCAEIEMGAGALLIAEEYLYTPQIGSLKETLENQPSWSELPILVLLQHGSETHRVQNTLLLPGDVILVERPVRVNTFVAYVHAALRSRRRQYLVRDQMQELERSERRYRTLFTSIDEGFCVVRVLFDEQGKPIDFVFLETNPSFEKHTGITHPAGRRMREFAPKHEEHWFEAYGQVASTGQPIRFQNRAGEFGRWYDVYAFRYGEPEAREVAILFTDITERKQWEDTLQKSEKKFVQIFNSVPALIGITTLDEGRVVDLNKTAEDILGYRREEAIGKTSAELALWGNGSDRDTIVSGLKKHRSVRNVEIEFKGRSGQACTGLYSAEIIELDQTPHLLSMVQDITERKQAVKEIERLNASLEDQVSELRETNLELDAFNRMVSHDLRQPINSIGLYVQMIEMLCAETLDEECREYVGSIRDRLKGMNDLINTLLTFSSSTRGELQRESLDLSELARDVASGLRLNEPKRSVSFIIPQSLPAHGDRTLLRAVIENLIGNAWKYTGAREEATIEVGTTDIEGEAAFFVRDNGMGFDMASAGDVFSPFTRLPGADQFRGFGIGLATVDRIVRRHGGRVWADAEPGKGATFYFTLPADGIQQ